MKLYTKEDIKKVISLSRQSYGYDGYKFDEDEIFKDLTPIELPSDEEIRMETQFATNDFYWGAKWMKEQILNQKK